MWKEWKLQFRGALWCSWSRRRGCSSEFECNLRYSRRRGGCCRIFLFHLVPLFFLFLLLFLFLALLIVALLLLLFLVFLLHLVLLFLALLFLQRLFGSGSGSGSGSGKSGGGGSSGSGDGSVFSRWSRCETTSQTVDDATRWGFSGRSTIFFRACFKLISW